MLDSSTSCWAPIKVTTIKDKSIFITGGAGFIGSSVAGRLVDDNKVVIYDNFSRNSIKDKTYKDHPNLTLVDGDILDLAALSTAMRGANIVVHCAAVAGVTAVINNPLTTMQVNVIGSANVLEAASQLSDCQHVSCFSTSEVFGQYSYHSSEDANAVIGQLGDPRWTYATSKLTSEHFAIAYHQQKGLPATVIRPFNVYGPGQVGEGAIFFFVQKALKNEPIEIHGDGSQIRAWCYVDDMVDGVLLAMAEPRAAGQSFNIGNERTVTTIHNLANTVLRITGSHSPIVFIEKDYADVELRIPSARKAKEILGFEAKVDLEEGIRRTAEYFRGRLG